MRPDGLQLPPLPDEETRLNAGVDVNSHSLMAWWHGPRLYLIGPSEVAHIIGYRQTLGIIPGLSGRFVKRCVTLDDAAAISQAIALFIRMDVAWLPAYLDLEAVRLGPYARGLP